MAAGGPRESTIIRDVLSAELEARRARNPRYSLRAYARDLKLSPSRLSEVISGRHRLSGASAAKVVDGLRLTAAERALFVALVDAENPREAVRVKAKRALPALKARVLYSKLDEEKFRLIGAWEHAAILELLATKGAAEKGPPWFARRLGIEPARAAEAIERLIAVWLNDRANHGPSSLRARRHIGERRGPCRTTKPPRVSAQSRMQMRSKFCSPRRKSFAI